MSTSTSSSKRSRSCHASAASTNCFDRWEDAGTTVVITDSWISEVRPDGIGKFIADISATVPECRRLIKRVEAGVASAQEQGKWTDRVPTDFRHDDDGYLQVFLDPDREDGEGGYLEVRRALEHVSDGESIRAVARDLPDLSRQGLSKIDNDFDRRRWYLGAEAADDRVDTALETVR